MASRAPRSLCLSDFPTKFAPFASKKDTVGFSWHRPPADTLWELRVSPAPIAPIGTGGLRDVRMMKELTPAEPLSRSGGLVLCGVAEGLVGPVGRRGRGWGLSTSCTPCRHISCLWWGCSSQGVTVAGTREGFCLFLNHKKMI